jgi:hypothetical protein
MSKSLFLIPQSETRISLIMYLASFSPVFASPHHPVSASGYSTDPEKFEPGLVKRRQAGDRRKAECISCNSCFGPPSEGKGFYCVTMAKKRGKTI